MCRVYSKCIVYIVFVQGKCCLIYILSVYRVCVVYVYIYIICGVSAMYILYV